MPDTPVQDAPFDFAIEYNSDFILDRYRISEEADDQLNELFPEIYKGKKSTIKRLHRLCKKYPHIPQFKNYLSIAYDNAGNHQKAIQVNSELLQKHPGYLFARIYQAETLINKSYFDEVPDHLGEEMHIHKLYPERDRFHIGEVTKYYLIAIQYLLKTDRVDEAKLRLHYLSEIEPKAPETELALFAFMQHNMKKNMQRFENERLMDRRVDSRSYPIDLQTNQPPAFTHSEIEELYKYGMNIPDKIIQAILELPRESLITDLEHVLEDAIYRYEYFYNEADEEGWNEDRYNFSIHAILLLTELRSEKSIVKILDLLRQGDDFREFWYSDLLEDIFSESVTILASGNLEKITDFVKEPDLDAYCRNVGVSALEIMAFLHPDHRDEVIDHFEDLIQFHLSQLDNDRIIDTTLLSFLVWSCVNIGAKELLPSIRQLYEHDLIHETMVGDLKDVEQDIKGEMIDRSEQSATIFERYESLTSKPFMGDFPLPEKSPDNYGTLDLFSDFREDDPFDPYEPLPFEPRLEPSTNPYKDVGRNDPCPCGSGKKYKKCCL